MKTTQFIPLALSLMTAAVSSQASVSFENTGTTSGWDTIFTQHNGTVTQVSSPVFHGSTSLRCRQIYIGAPSTTRYHSEVIKRGAQLNGTDRYYGQTMFIQSNWTIGESAVCQQWATEDPSAPWLGMNMDGANLNWDAVRGPMAPPAPEVFSPITRGVWVRVVTRIKMTNPGVLEVWVNGTKKLSKSGDWSTAHAANSSIRWSTGIYLGWHNKTPVGQTDLSIWHDHLRIATTQSEAEPANWGATTSGVTFYSSVSYGGTASQLLAKGTYTMSQLAAKGIANDSASSVRIPSGWTVTIYQNDNFGGTSWVLTGDTSSFTAISGLNDAMSSCRIE